MRFPLLPLASREQRGAELCEQPSRRRPALRRRLRLQLRRLHKHISGNPQPVPKCQCDCDRRKHANSDCARDWGALGSRRAGARCQGAPPAARRSGRTTGARRPARACRGTAPGCWPMPPRSHGLAPPRLPTQPPPRQHLPEPDSQQNTLAATVLSTMPNGLVFAPAPAVSSCACSSSSSSTKAMW